MMEEWKSGMVEYWNNKAGGVEEWNGGMME
jgi:hypothetical protein